MAVRRCLVVIIALLAGFARPSVTDAQTADSVRPPAATAGREIRLPSSDHGRLLGVFNANSGDPVEGAEVWDMIAKAFVTTSSTGTAPLSWVRSQHDSAVIWIRKVGFQD